MMDADTFVKQEMKDELSFFVGLKYSLLGVILNNVSDMT